MSVIVIGAGFSGLWAARTLQAGSRSVQVTVLEGSGRVGGRAHTLQTEHAGQVELGATWLHGIVGHPAYDIAVERGLVQASDKQRAKSQWGMSVFVREDEAEPMGQEDAKVAALAGKVYSDAVEEAQKPQHSAGGATVGAFLRQKWQQVRKERGSDPIWAEAWHWRENLQRAIDGCHTTDEMSSAGLAAYSELKGPNMPLSCGYSKIASVVAENLDVRFQHVVERIEWGENGASVHCSSGAAFKCDAVICTVSLGVLKKEHHRLFAPPLPVPKQAAIERLGMGIVDKLFIRFRPNSSATDGSTAQESLPGRNVLSHQLLWKVDADNQSWDSSSPAGNADGYKASTARRPWWQGSYSLRIWGPEFLAVGRGGEANADASVPDATLQTEGRGRPQQPAVADTQRIQGIQEGSDTTDASTGKEDIWAVMWMSGEAAEEMEACTDAEVHEGIEKVLDAFPAIKVPRDFSVLRTRWGSDVLHRGSYSYVSARSSPADVETLSQPLECKGADGVTRPVVMFAGEATHVHHIGTVHGACFTGEQEAQRLMRYFQEKSNAAVPV